MKIDPGLVPLRPNDGCPKGTIDGISTCFCEDHCSWHVCRLANPPMDCPKVVSWQMDSTLNYWVAQDKIGKNWIMNTFAPNGVLNNNEYFKIKFEYIISIHCFLIVLMNTYPRYIH